ncbi:MAG: family 10 glycosylhydrolase [Deltaproteobacteria bacterium]|nr:family 10 glycosylhydrolase [Deltaproteobacteria bacterium]
MKNSRKTALKLVIVLGLTLLFLPVKALHAGDNKHPQWWLRDGICFVGNWEPLSFRIRNGRVPRDYMAHYEFEHQESTVRELKQAGVNMVITHFYKGLGLEHEKEDLSYTRKLVKNLKKHGMYAGAYIGSTLFSETLYREIPGSSDWVQLNRRGEPIIYSDQYFRERADFTQDGYREQIKKVVEKAIEDYGVDLIHFDNFYTMFPLDAGHTRHIQRLFREYLETKYRPKQRKERLGFEDVSLVRPPRVANRPMAPVTDPLVQEWIEFRVEVLSDFVRELSTHIRKLNPETIVEFNPHGIWGQNNAYANGMDHARLLPLSDIFWSEDPDHARYFPDQNRLVSKIRSYKLGRKFGNALFSYNNSPLELAEAMAFNRMCLGDVPWSIIENEEATRVNREFISFFNRNKELYRDLETIADVGVMRDFESLTFGGWVPFLATVQAEQVLIQNRVPFTLLFDQDWDNLEDYKVVVLAAQENLTNEEIDRLESYLQGGGALAVVGSTTGAYDSWRRARGGGESFWSLLGAGELVRDPRSPARFSLGKGRVFYLPGFENHPGVPRTDDQIHPDYWYLPLNWEEFLEGISYCRNGDYTLTVETKPWVAAAHYRKGRMRQVHLVNYWPGHPVRYIPVIVSENGLKPANATLYSPEHEPLNLDLGTYMGGWMTLVPELDTYAVVVFE